MANLTEADQWEIGIYQLEEDDPVLGGPSGIDNRPPRELANRTGYLRRRGVSPWDATLSYPANVAHVSYGGTTWKSVGDSTNVAPGSDTTKWVRWAFTAAELASVLGDAVATHEAKTDPHPQYVNDAELAAGIAAHEAKTDPHPQYATDAEFAAHVYAENPHPQYATDADLAAHVADLNPHAQYVRHDAAQGLTTTQARQARANIDAPQTSQVAGVVGTVRNLKASLAAAGNSATFTADEVVVETALGGVRYCVPNVNKTINLAAVGAGGMDTGAAPTGFVGVYLLLNPNTGATALIGVNGSAAVLPEIYGGANMPAGYTASALISCLRTVAGTGFQVFAQTNRSISVATVLEQSTSTATTTPVAFTATSLSRNAKTVSGSVTFSCNAAAGGGTSVFGFSAGVGAQGINLTVSAGGTASVSFSNVPVIAPPTLYYTGTTSAGTGTYQVSVSGYTI
ncbi:hypothetical protein A3K87_04410 [Variovorax paradoxus]|uniref:Tail fiber protein n=1 Tax=Variovorax paradoxus TaxID=34073 RepID=A0AA91DI96_VARPD|nr:hypothetical protein [Variovorax paradoxus]OAK55045.1 hypothetical protein A3K87_04410 [Variovorax paradoxus]